MSSNIRLYIPTLCSRSPDGGASIRSWCDTHRITKRFWFHIIVSRCTSDYTYDIGILIPCSDRCAVSSFAYELFNTSAGTIKRQALYSRLQLARVRLWHAMSVHAAIEHSSTTTVRMSMM